MRETERGGRKLCIRMAREEDAAQLRGLFASVFGESEQGLRLFFSRIFAPARTAVAEEDGKILGMFYILPAALRSRGEDLPAAYLYALAVDPARRSQGIAGKILAFLDTWLPRMGYAAAVLHPAQPSLFRFYARHGFTDAIPANLWRFRADALPPAAGALLPAALDALPGGRARYFPGRDPLFLWDDGMLRYAQDYAALGGGGAAALATPEGLCYAVYTREGERLLIHELGGPRPAELSAALCARLRVREGVAVLPAGSPFGETVPYAAARWYGERRDCANGYLALTLE